jgi:hypothetical protein
MEKRKDGNVDEDENRDADGAGFKYGEGGGCRSEIALTRSTSSDSQIVPGWMHKTQPRTG